MQINAETTKRKEHKNKMTKPQRNNFSKYCEDNTKKLK
jgi:hypothetical protein